MDIVARQKNATQWVVQDAAAVLIAGTICCKRLLARKEDRKGPRQFKNGSGLDFFTLMIREALSQLGTPKALA